MTPKVYSYLRFSTAEQAKGDSKRRQTDLAGEYCEKHGLTLTDPLSDLGVSAFRGKNQTKGLKDFLDLVEAKAIQPGTILLVEELDRISRQSPDEALRLFLNIIGSGVKIITLNGTEESDWGVFERGKIDMGRLMVAVVKFCTAHDESFKKSIRIGKAWADKRTKIGQKPLTRMLPHWLKMHEGRIVPDESKAAIVRQIFSLAIGGHGLYAITQKLNASGGGIGRAKFWHRSYVSKILHNRSVFGEFQPHKLMEQDGKKRREPVGEPIPDYFPAVVSEKDFYAAQKSLTSRKTSSGPHTKFINILAGLVFSDDGSSLVLQNKGFGRRFVSTATILGLKGHAPYVAFPVQALNPGISGFSFFPLRIPPVFLA